MSATDKRNRLLNLLKREKSFSFEKKEDNPDEYDWCIIQYYLEKIYIPRADNIKEKIELPPEIPAIVAKYDCKLEVIIVKRIEWQSSTCHSGTDYEGCKIPYHLLSTRVDGKDFPSTLNDSVKELVDEMLSDFVGQKISAESISSDEFLEKVKKGKINTFFF